MSPSHTKYDKGDCYALLEMRGRRGNMEDTSSLHNVEEDALKGPVHSMLFGVYDGHGGEECSDFCKENVLDAVASHPKYKSNPKQALTDAFISVDEEYLEMARDLELDDGSTCTVLQLQYDPVAKKCYYYLACSGDSRAVLVKQGGGVLGLSDDHVPMRMDERIRIEKEGGSVLFDIDNGIYRVASALGGGLAVTRAIGDMYFKPFVTAEPEVNSGEITSDDQYICLASDGLWGDLDNKETAQLIHEFGANEAVRELANSAYLRGSEDNITIIIVDLHKAANILMARAGHSPEVPAAAANVVSPVVASAVVAKPKAKSVSRKSSKRASVSDNNKSKRTSTSKRTSEQRWNETKPHKSQVRRSIRVAPVILPQSDEELSDEDSDDVVDLDSNDAIAARRRSQLHRRGQSSGVWIVSGLDPEGSVTALLLWQDPIRTGIWFFTLLIGFFLINIVEYSFLSLVCNLLIMQLLGSVAIVHAQGLLKSIGVLNKDFDGERFVRESAVFTDELIERTSTTAYAVSKDWFDVWETTVHEGSTTSVLAVLRNMSYMFTPIAFAHLIFVVFIGLFSLPVTYVNNRRILDELQARFGAWWHRTWDLFGPIGDMFNNIGSGFNSLFSKLGFINEISIIEKIKSKKEKKKRSIVGDANGSISGAIEGAKKMNRKSASRKALSFSAAGGEAPGVGVY